MRNVFRSALFLNSDKASKWREAFERFGEESFHFANRAFLMKSFENRAVGLLTRK